VRKFIAILCILFTSVHVDSQTILLLNNVRDDVEMMQENGVNRMKYNAPFIAFGWNVGSPESDSLGIIPFRSPYFSMGAMVKIKMNNFIAFQLSSLFTYQSFRLKQDSLKRFIDPVHYKKETLNLWSYQVGMGFRINFDPKRGNHLGHHLDVGGYAAYRFVRRRLVESKSNSGGIDTPYSYTEKKLRYVNVWDYGAEARLGYSYYQLFVRYRLSELFRPYANTDFTELPRFTAGIGINLSY
jgi:hypothetical protein